MCSYHVSQLQTGFPDFRVSFLKQADDDPSRQPGSPAKQSVPTFNTAELAELYAKGEHEQRSCEQFLSILDVLSPRYLQSLNPGSQYFVSSFVKVFLYTVSQPDFRIDEPLRQSIHQGLEPRRSPIVVAMSSFKTTDAYLEILRDQQGNFLKILMLYSARNSVKSFSIAKPSSIWFPRSPPALVSRIRLRLLQRARLSPIVHENMKEHFAFSHPNLVIPHNFQELYFGSTYVDGRCDTPVKEQINSTSCKNTSKLSPRSSTNPIRRRSPLSAPVGCRRTPFTAPSAPNTSSRSKGKYHLTHLQLRPLWPAGNQNVLTSRYTIPTIKGQPDLSRIRNNDFQVVFFPDVGMCAESILLANMRIAPIQIMGASAIPSAPGAELTSTTSSAAKTVEGSRTNPEQNWYSERLVLLPGIGRYPQPPLLRTPASQEADRRNHHHQLSLVRTENQFPLPHSDQKTPRQACPPQSPSSASSSASPLPGANDHISLQVREVQASQLPVLTASKSTPTWNTPAT